MGSFNGRNNCMFFYGPITAIGKVHEVQTAIEICKGFEVIVIGVHTGNDLVNLNRVIPASKATNAGQKWYGYVAFGSTGSGVSATAVDQWMTDCPPSSGLIDGIFLDEFGHDFPSGTRDQQNAIIDYCHDTINGGTGLPVFVNPWIPTDVFGQPPGNANNATPSFGAHATHKDTVLLESWLWSVDSSSPPATGNWTRDKGRLEYFLDQRDNNSKNMQICAMMGVGAGTGQSANYKLDDDQYKEAMYYLEDRNVDLVCVNHGDLAAVSNTFFIQNTQNIWPSPIASGASQYLKF